MKKNNYLKQKMEGCLELANLDKKKITDTVIYNIAKKHSTPYIVMKNAWMNFVQTGGKYVDLRQRSLKGSIKMNSTKKCTITRQRGVSSETAGKIILEYMTTNITSRELCQKYNITILQFYGWLKELNISGTLLDRKVLDFTKYAKLDVKDVIWYYRYPNTKRVSITTKTQLELEALKRVATVLKNYL